MRILHILDHSIPLHSGYTFRSRNILRQQRALGWHTAHVTGLKQGNCGSTTETVDGLCFYRTRPGASPLLRLPVLDQGDESVAFAPYFVEYVNYSKMYNGVPRIVSFDDNFIPKMDELEAVIGPRTKCVIVNSPHNPTGIVYSEEVLHRIGEIIQKKEGLVLTIMVLEIDFLFWMKIILTQILKPGYLGRLDL